MTNSLVRLAKQGTEAARGALFMHLCEFVTSDLEKRTNNELKIFSEVILKLYGNSSELDRARLAQKISRSVKTPVPLAEKLARDDVAVAMPILANSPVFSQENLLDLIEGLSAHHLQALARRTDLSTEVSDALVQKGDTPVHRILAGNREIQLSRQSMLLFVKLAAEDVALREDLAQRSDLSPSACRALMPLVDEKTKKRLSGMMQGALSQEQLEQIEHLKQLRRKLGEALSNRDISLLWAECQRVKVSVDDLTILLLQDGRFTDVIELLGNRGRIAQKALKDAVFNGKLDIVIRTAARSGLQAHTFALFVKARCDHLKIPSSQGAEWTNTYSSYLKSQRAASDNRCSDFKAKRAQKKSRPTLVKRRLAAV